MSLSKNLIYYHYVKKEEGEFFGAHLTALIQRRPWRVQGTGRNCTCRGNRWKKMGSVEI